MDRAQAVFRCLACLLSCDTGGEPAHAKDVLLITNYKGLNVYEKSVRATLTKQGEPVFWQPLIDEVIKTSASTMSLQPLFEQVTQRVAKIEDCSAADLVTLTGDLKKLRNGVRSRPLQGIESKFLNGLKVVSNFILKTKEVEKVKADVLDAVVDGLQLFTKQSGIVDTIAQLNKWVTMNTPVYACNQLELFIDNMCHSRRINMDELAKICKKCQKEKMSESCLGKLETFAVEFLSISFAQACGDG